MDITITIPDDSDELDELQTVVAKVNAEAAENTEADPITEQEYVQNVVLGYFTNRVLNEFKGYAAKQNVAVLKKAFGSLSDVRKAK